MAFEIPNVVQACGSFDATAVVAVASPGVFIRRWPAGGPAGDFEVLVEGADFTAIRTIFVASLDNPVPTGVSLNVTPTAADTLRVTTTDLATAALANVNFSILCLNIR